MLGSAEHKTLAYGRSILEPARNLAYSVLGERGRVLVKRGLASWRAKRR